MIIDLSHVLDAETPVYPGDPATEIEQSAVFSEVGYEGHSISIGTHAGTHIDAPSHMIKDGKNLDQFPIESFVGRGVYIDAAGSDVLSLLKQSDIKAGDVVLINTGTYKRFHDLSYFTDYPVLSEGAVDILIQRRVKMVGLDTCSADNSTLFPVHKALLGSEILIIENLTNLSGLEGVSKFTVHALPLRLSLDGAPARVIASSHQ